MKSLYNMRVVTLALFVFSLAFGIIQVFGMGLTNDTDLFMYQALIMWRNSGMIYNYITEVNAPFNMMIYAPLAAFSAYTHASPAIILHGFAFLVCLVSLFSLHDVLKRQRMPDKERETWCAAAAFTLLVITPAFEVFADREHLLFAFALPWIMQMLLRMNPRPYTAVLAAIGFCMRPHNIVLLAMLSFIGGPRDWSLRQRIFSVSSWIIGILMAAYAVVVMVFFPAYLSHIVPIASKIYGGVQISLPHKLLMGSILIFPALALTIEFVKIDKPVWYGFIVAIFLLFLVNSGWSYTCYLPIVPLVLVCALPWCSPFKEHLPYRTTACITSAVILLGVFAFSAAELKRQIIAKEETGTSVEHFHLSPSETGELRKASGKEFILLSVDLWNINVEPFNAKPQSVFGFVSLWPLRWMEGHEQDKNYSSVLHFITDPLLVTMQQHPDAPVFIDTSPTQAYQGNRKVIDILEEDSRIKSLLMTYTLEKTIDYCTVDNTIGCRFEIWRGPVFRREME